MSTRSSPRASELPVTPAVALERDITIELPKREPVQARTYGSAPRGAGLETPLVLHFHGGNFVCGDLDDGRSVARMLAGAGAVVVSMAYPLAPLHPFPDAIEVGYEALEWLHKQRTRLAGKGSRIFLAGEEAGGNLAAALALIARDRAHPPLAGQILMSPMLDPCAGTASLRDASCDLVECKYAEGWLKYLGRPRDAEHPYAVPAASLRLSDLAPTLVLAGPDDPMRDEALAYAKRLRAAGVRVMSNVVASAEGWPASLAQSPEATASCCIESVTRHFSEFFDATRTPLAAQPPH